MVISMGMDFLYFICNILLFKKFSTINIFKIIVTLFFFIILIFTFFYQDENKYYRFVGFYFGILVCLFPIKILNKQLGILFLLNLFFLILIYGKFVENFSNKFTLPLFYIFFDLNIYLLINHAFSNDTIVKSIFQNKFFFFLGKISYSFYLVHSLLGVFFAKIFIMQLGFPISNILSYLIAFIFCIIFASILYIISERPYFYFKNK